MFIFFIINTWILSLASRVIGGCSNSLTTELSFTPVSKNLVWPDLTMMETYSATGRYIPKNIIVSRMQINKGKAIIAMPRLKPGVPFTLGVMQLNKKYSDAIVPFPSYPIQEEGNCRAIQNAVDIYLDFQNILWVLDSGIVNILTQPVRRCTPKVIGIDTNSGKVIQNIDLSNLIAVISNLQYIAVDYAEDGRLFLYITDAPTKSIIVYEVINKRGYRVKLPKAICLTSALRNVLYIALVRKVDGTRVLYLTYLNSSRIFSIKACHLRNGGINGAVIDEGPKKKKIVFVGSDGNCSIFFRKKGHSDVYKWNVNVPFDIESCPIVKKGNECRLTTHVVPGMKNAVWAVESNFPDYISNTIPRSGPSMSIHPLKKTNVVKRMTGT